jgi:hypothetical protein
MAIEVLRARRDAKRGVAPEEATERAEVERKAFEQ